MLPMALWEIWFFSISSFLFFAQLGKFFYRIRVVGQHTCNSVATIIFRMGGCLLTALSNDNF